jgi:hypothetical protein
MSDQEWTPVTHDDCGNVEALSTIRQMLTHLDELRCAGRAVIED